MATDRRDERTPFVVAALVRATDAGELQWTETAPQRYAVWGGAHWIYLRDGSPALLSVVINFVPRERLVLDAAEARRLRAAVKASLERGTDRGFGVA